MPINVLSMLFLAAAGQSSIKAERAIASAPALKKMSYTYGSGTKADYAETVKEYFSQPAKVFTNPEGSTINPLTGTAYIQPVELYPVTPQVSENRAAVEAIKEYDETGSISDALLVAGDDPEARHALISKWLGVYG
jgi:hypothetical protein